MTNFRVVWSRHVSPLLANGFFRVVKSVHSFDSLLCNDVQEVKLTWPSSLGVGFERWRSMVQILHPTAIRIHFSEAPSSTT